LNKHEEIPPDRLPALQVCMECHRMNLTGFENMTGRSDQVFVLRSNGQ
jgi:hypothetical protein